MKSLLILCLCSLLLSASPAEAAPVAAPIPDQSGFLNADAIPPLISHLRDTDPDIRKDAAFNIGRLRQPAKVAIIPQLTALLKDSNSDIRRSAAGAFSSFLMDAIELREGAVKAVLPLLQDPNRDVRNSAAQALGFMNKAKLAEALVPELISQLKDADPQARISAIDTLASLRAVGESAIPQILILLKDPVPSVRINAAYAAGLLGASVAGVSDHLERMQKDDPDPEVRKAVSEALFNLYYIDNERIRNFDPPYDQNN